MIILCFRGKINISGCSAVGSARGSGLRGRQFESGHPDHYEKKNNPSGIIFVFICIGATRWERSSTGRRSERKIKACFYFFERGGTEGFWKNPNLVTQTMKWYLPNWRNVPRGKRQFESGHPDHSRRKNKENLFSLFDRRRMERFCESKSLPWNYQKDWSDSSLFDYK